MDEDDPKTRGTNAGSWFVVIAFVILIAIERTTGARSMRMTMRMTMRTRDRCTR
jgi:hypothetical protein